MIDICCRKTKPILLGVCYRTPQQNSFYDQLENVLVKCSKWMESECILIADFNTDIPKNPRKVLKNLGCSTKTVHAFLSPQMEMRSIRRRILPITLKRISPQLPTNLWRGLHPDHECMGLVLNTLRISIQSQFLQFLFVFFLVSVEQIVNMLKDLNSAKATGLDKISARFLKHAADLLLLILLNSVFPPVLLGYYCCEQYKDKNKDK